MFFKVFSVKINKKAKCARNFKKLKVHEARKWGDFEYSIAPFIQHDYVGLVKADSVWVALHWPFGVRLDRSGRWGPEAVHTAAPPKP